MTIKKMPRDGPAVGGRTEKTREDSWRDIGKVGVVGAVKERRITMISITIKTKDKEKGRV